MNPIETRSLGRSEVAITRLGFGAGPLGDAFARVGDTNAQATLATAWDEGVRYFDTSPSYGLGLSELRVGEFLRGRSPDHYVVSTKVGRRLHRPREAPSATALSELRGLPFEYEFDYSYDGIMRSYEDSLQRLGLARVDMLVIHDLDFRHHAVPARVAAYLAQLTTSGWKALEELRRAGEIRAIGAGINELGMIPRFLDLFGLEFFLVAMPYTLLDQDAAAVELPRCVAERVSVIIGSVFNSGILATGVVPGAKYNYLEPSPQVIARVRRLEDLCRRHDVPLAAAALQFPLAHPAVAAVLPGGTSPDQVRRNVGLLDLEISDAFWQELRAEGLIREEAPTPSRGGGR